MTIDQRRRRANLRFNAAIVCMPVLLLVCVAAITPKYLSRFDNGWRDIGLAGVAVVGAAVLSVGYALLKGYRSTRSSEVVITIGFFTGLIGGLVCIGMLGVAVDPGNDKNFMFAGVVPLVVIGIVLPLRLVKAGRRALWEPIDDELIASGAQVVVRGRGRPKITIAVDDETVTLARGGSDSFALVEDLRDVETVTVTKSLNEERRDLTGGGDESTVSPGGAVRVRLARGEWYFPVNDAEATARLITRRRDQAVASHPERDDKLDPLGDFQEVVFHARRDRRIALTVDSRSLVMKGSRRGETFYAYSPFDDLVSVEVTDIRADERVDVTGDGDEAQVTAGEALRITVEDGVWLFPIEKADGIAELIGSRVERYRLLEQEFEWPARDDPALELTVDDYTVTLDDRRKYFSDIESVVAVPTETGETVRLRFDDDSEWLFPADNAPEIVATITRRVGQDRLEDEELDNA